MLTFTSKLIRRKQLTPHVSLFQFSTENAPEFIFQAGQYIIIHVPQVDGSTARRLYSIASPPSQKGTIELVIEIVPGGVGSQFVSNLIEGNEVTIQGPAGLFTLKEQTNSVDQIVFLATGTGIAPIRSMIQELFSEDSLSLPKVRIEDNSQLSTPHSYTLLWGLKHYADTYFLDEFINLAQKHDNFSFTVCLSQEKYSTISKYPHAEYLIPGRMTGLIDEMIKKRTDKHPSSSPPLTKGGMGGVKPQLQTPNSDFYLCGGRHVVENIKNNLLEKGIIKDHLHFEKF